MQKIHQTLTVAWILLFFTWSFNLNVSVNIRGNAAWSDFARGRAQNLDSLKWTMVIFLIISTVRVNIRTAVSRSVNLFQLSTFKTNFIRSWSFDFNVSFFRAIVASGTTLSSYVIVLAMIAPGCARTVIIYSTYNFIGLLNSLN